MTTPEFIEFPKIPRLNREVIVTEKIDGTNAIVHVSDDGLTVTAGSRSRWITPQNDNHGFARWVHEHEEELRVGLGPGLHYGEWWGSGIQRGYGLAKGEKRFSLFNVSRWTDDVRPKCCHVVPELARGIGLSTHPGSVIADGIALLRTAGSQAAPGFLEPEGIVAFHVPSGNLYKVTLEHDEASKGRSGASGA